MQAIEHLTAYLFCCWVQMAMTILESVAGNRPHRFDWTEGADRCRPESFAEYREFRRLQG